MDWRIPRVTLGDVAVQSSGPTGPQPVTPYIPPPVIVLQAPTAPQPDYTRAQVALPIPAPWTAQAQPKINISVSAPVETPKTFFDIFTRPSLDIPTERTGTTAQAPSAAPPSFGTGPIVVRQPIPRAQVAVQPKAQPGTWSDAELTELQLAKNAASFQGKYGQCTNAAHCVKSAVDSLGLQHLNTVLWRWKGVSGQAHSAVIVYPKWGTPETGIVLDQWWLSSFLRGNAYLKKDRPGGFAYKGADWEPYDPDYGGGGAAGTTKRAYNEEVRRKLKESKGE